MFLTKFSSVLTNAIEAAFAPETSLYEDFIYHWQAIMNYYSEFTDDTIHIDGTNIPNHLKQMLHILIEEENNITSIEAGPCMEFLLQQKILETLATLGVGDTPMGMKSKSLFFFTTILNKIRQPMLAHQAVFNPVIELMKICGKVQASPTEFEEINFLSIICTKLYNETHLVKFFILDEDFENLKKNQKLDMERDAAIEVLKQKERDDEKNRKIEKRRRKQEKLQNKLLRDSMGNSQASDDSSEISSDSEDSDSSQASSGSQPGVPIEEDAEIPPVPSEDNKSQISNTTNHSKATSHKSGISLKSDPDKPEKLLDLGTNQPHSTSTSKYRSASGHTANFTDTSSEHQKNSSRNTSKDHDEGGRITPEAISELLNQEIQNKDLQDNASHITESSRSSVNLSSAISKNLEESRDGSFSRNSSHLAGSRLSSLHSRPHSALSDTHSSVSIARSKNTSTHSSLSQKSSHPLTKSDNSSSVSGPGKISNSGSSSSTSSSALQNKQEVGDTTTESLITDHEAMTTHASLLTTSENCSDTDDEVSLSEDERNMAILKINLFGHNIKEQENAVRQVKIYMSSYGLGCGNFEIWGLKPLGEAGNQNS